MENLSTYSFVVLIVAIIISRIITEKALKLLSSEQKVLLIDSFSKFRMYSMIPLLLILAAYALVSEFHYFHSVIWLILYFVFIILIFVIIQIVSIRKLKNLNLPDGYKRKYYTSQSIVFIGFIVFFGMTIYPLFTDFG